MRTIVSISVALILTLVSVTLVRSDSLDNAEAVKRGVPVDLILLEKRVAELERMNAMLLQRIAALEKPQSANGGLTAEPATTAPADDTTAVKTTPGKIDTDLEIVFNKMPEEIRPADSDTDVKQELKAKQREAWLKANVLGKTLAVSIKVVNVDSSGNVVGYCYHEGQLKGRWIMCVPTATTKAKALSLDKYQEIEVYGKISFTAISGYAADGFSLSNCSFK